MSDDSVIYISGKAISCANEILSIHNLKYLEENPRVLSCIHGEERPIHGDELQHFLHGKMLEQTSVKNLIPEIKDHGGLVEPILVRHDTKQVIEGNSRLAVYRKLYEETKDPRWAEIQCRCVAKLTPEEQDAYLSEIHLKGRTQWSPYEKAYLAYTRHRKDNLSVEATAKRLRETPGNIKKLIKAVELMAKNNDKDRSNFSYYDVLVRTRKINQSDNYDERVEGVILEKIREHSGRFKAQELRAKLPIILNKKKILQKFVGGTLNFDEAYDEARPSDPRRKVTMAKAKLEAIEETEISRLEMPELKAFHLDVKKLLREVTRVESMVKSVQENKSKKAHNVQ